MHMVGAISRPLIGIWVANVAMQAYSAITLGMAFQFCADLHKDALDKVFLA